MTITYKELEQELNWRIREFANFKKMGIQLKATYQDETFLRMTIPMIYAHWEGFVSQAFKIVFEYLNKQNLEPHRLKHNIFIYSIEKNFDSLKGKASFNNFCDFTDNLFSILNEKVLFNTKIVTKSNLKYDIFVELCEKISLPTNDFLPYKYELDKLVHLRNQISHGEKGIAITLPMRDELIRVVTLLMQTFTIVTIEYVENHTF